MLGSPGHRVRRIPIVLASCQLGAGQVEAGGLPLPQLPLLGKVVAVGWDQAQGQELTQRLLQAGLELALVTLGSL